MAPVGPITELEAQLSDARDAASLFLVDCTTVTEAVGARPWEVPVDLRTRARELSRLFHTHLVRLSSLVRQSPMLGQLDLDVIRLALYRIDAALRLRSYEEWGPRILSNEDVVLAVRPSGFSEDVSLNPTQALREIDDALDHASRLLSILRAEAEAEATGYIAPSRVQSGATPIEIRPGTAFIIMMIDPKKPGLEDVKQAIKETCAGFGIRAIRSDDIEHSDEITQRILDEIRTSEFLIADLTDERPSVYYEVGFAHAIGKRPILYRRTDTKLHFDLAFHNCPEYSSTTELREKLRKRLSVMTGKE